MTVFFPMIDFYVLIHDWWELGNPPQSIDKIQCIPEKTLYHSALPSLRQSINQNSTRSLSSDHQSTQACTASTTA
ncbi:hexokinase A [Puccinia graminis f. sp. tritici]|uniref:Hexokinase A n=1 Tax=Puccinia graminis f. sp. tritici TaxID=56615 RepID=A0A5B0SNF5_PUCGR|nr:hexokinase A [Puccinia graminis f. sp. tritici]